ncbi:MAG: tetratricopeptide repeat protein [Phycisphaerae bacterium]
MSSTTNPISPRPTRRLTAARLLEPSSRHAAAPVGLLVHGRRRFAIARAAGRAWLRECVSAAAAVVLVSLAIGLVRASPSRADDAAQREAGAADSPALPHYLAGNGLLNRGLHELAAVEYRAFLEADRDHPRVPAARYGLAVCLFRQNDFDGAARELARVVKVDGFEFAADARLLLAQCALQRGDAAAAIGGFEQLLKDFPDHAHADDAAAGVIECLYRESKAVLVCEQARSFAQRWPNSPLRERVLYLRSLAEMSRREWTNASQQLTELLQTYPEGAFRDHATLLLAQCLDDQGRADDALLWYRRVLEGAHGDYVPDALLGLGALLVRQRKPADALPHLDRLLRDFPQTPHRFEARLQRGRALLEQGDAPAAQQVFDELTRDGGGHADAAALWSAKCRLRAGDAPGAGERLAAALEKHPQSALVAEMRYDRALALFQSGAFEAAAEAAREFRTRHPEHELAADALHLAALSEHRRGRYAESARLCDAFERAFAAHPTAPAAAFLAAENAFLAGDYAGAERRYARFVELHGEHADAPKAAYRRGLALHRLNRDDDALPLLKSAATAAARDPLFRPALRALGEVQFDRADYAAAHDALRDYLAAEPPGAARAPVTLKQGLCLLRQKRYDDALRVLEGVDGQASVDVRRHAAFERGQALLVLERWDAAEAIFDALAREEGDNRFLAPALQHLAALASRRGDAAGAERYAGRAVAAEPDGASRSGALLQQARALLMQEKYSAAETSFRSYLSEAADSPPAAEARAQLAIAVARQNRPAEALPLLAAALSAGEGSRGAALRAALLYEQAWCLRQLGRDEEAARAYRELVDAPDAERARPHVLLELAEQEASAGRCDAARPLLQRLRAAAEPSSSGVPDAVLAGATYRLGVCEFQIGEHAAAADMLAEFVRRWPSHALALSAAYFCGEAAHRAGRLEAAATHLSRVLDAGPADAVYGPGLLRLAEVLATLQRWEKCEQAAARFLRDLPDHPQAHQALFSRAWALENMARYDDAIAAYRALLEQHQGPLAARAQFQIGECLFAQKKHDDAVRELLKVDVLYAYPEWSAAALYEAGRCFEVLGRPVEAREQFNRVRDRHAGTRWAELAAERLQATASGGLPGRAAPPQDGREGS